MKEDKANHVNKYNIGWCCVVMAEGDSKTLLLIIDYYASPASQAAAQVVNINFGFVARIP